jgi:hypothetical protein
VTVPDLEAHHVFPQKFEKFFSSFGVNINNPQFGQWVEQSDHGQYASVYNKAWQALIDQFDEAGVAPGQGATQAILSYGKKVMAYAYDLPVNY